MFRIVVFTLLILCSSIAGNAQSITVSGFTGSCANANGTYNKVSNYWTRIVGTSQWYIDGFPGGWNIRPNSGPNLASSTATTSSPPCSGWTSSCGTPVLTGGCQSVSTACNITLISGPASQTVCVGQPITPLVFSTVGGNNASQGSNFPPGVSYSYNSTNGNITISGTPTSIPTSPAYNPNQSVAVVGGTCTGNPAGLANFVINLNPRPSISISSSTDVPNCNPGAAGSATVSASGGTGTLTYNWTPSGGTATTATGLAAGTYTCTVTDGNGCTNATTVTISPPPSVSASISSQTNPACPGGTGTATVTASGTGALSYNWSPSGGTNATASGLAAGIYTCTVTDANNCTAATTATIVVTTQNAVTTINTNGASGNEANVTPTYATGIMGTPLVRGPGINPSSLANAFSSNGFSTSANSIASAVAAGDYLSMSVNASPGYELDLQSLDLKFRSSGTGPDNYAIQYQVNSGPFIDILSSTFVPSSNGVNLPSVPLCTIPALQNLLNNSTITIRIVLWGASSGGGTFAIGRSLNATDNGLVVNGELTVLPPCFTLTSSAASANQVLCVGQTMIPITYSVHSSVAAVGLSPTFILAGVNGSYAAGSPGTATINGTPTATTSSTTHAPNCSRWDSHMFSHNGSHLVYN